MIPSSPEMCDTLEALQLAAPVGLGLLDHDLRHIQVNQALTDFVGMRAEEVIGKTLEEVLPKLAPQLRPHLEKVLKTGEPKFDLEVEAPNAKTPEEARFWQASYFPVRNRQGHLIGVGIVARDITERQRALQVLRDSEQRYRAFLAHSREGIWRFELEEPIPIDLPVDQQIDLCYERAYLAECNEAMARMYGFNNASEIIGARMGQLLVRTVPENVAYLQAFFYSGYHLIDAETQEKDREGHWKYFLNSLIGIVENGKVLRAWGVQRDITERKLAEQAVEESRRQLAELNRNLETQIAARTEELRRKEQELFLARKLEAVGRLAGGVAHDFNNLLTGMLGLTADLKDSLPAEDARRQDCDIILNAGNRAFSLTQQLLAFGRRQIAQPKILNINDVVKDVGKLLGRLIGEDIQLKLELTASHPIEMDPGHLSQILMNLAINARDAMPNGGTLTLRTSDADVNGPAVKLEIEDTGRGMSEEVLAHIFEPYFTTKGKDKGTGLGLATVYGIVKQAGGDIRVTSTPGHGTRFTVHFPKASEPTSKAVSGKAPARASAGMGTILVVEDEEIVRRFVVRKLAQQGYRVLEAENGRTALDIVDRASQKIDLVVTDVVMPEMNGRELAQNLHRSQPDLEVLYMSGYPEEVIARRGVLERGISFIDKSHLNENLLEAVHHLLQ